MLQDEHILARKYCDRWMSKTLKVGPTCSALFDAGSSVSNLAGTSPGCLSHPTGCAGTSPGCLLHPIGCAGTSPGCLSHPVGCCGQLAAACCHSFGSGHFPQPHICTGALRQSRSCQRLLWHSQMQCFTSALGAGQCAPVKAPTLTLDTAHEHCLCPAILRTFHDG